MQTARSMDKENRRGGGGERDRQQQPRDPWNTWKSNERLDKVDRIETRNPLKECGRHEKRIGEDDKLMLRICETCGRHYYVCELCRKAKEIEAPISICIKCSPAFRTMKNLLDRKDMEIHELHTRVKRYDQDMKKIDELKKQIAGLKKSNDELRHEAKLRQDELATLRRNNQELESRHDEMSEDLRSKDDLTRDLKSLLTSQDYHDCVITSNGQKYNAHKSILSVRSERLKRLIEKQMSPAPPAPVDPKAKKSSNVPASSPRPPSHVLSLELDDIDVKLMPFFLNHLYTGSTDGISDTNVQNVMKMADKYELSGLRAACLLFMENRLNRSTVIPILIEAYELNNERLKNKCMRYMQTQQIDLLSSPQWTHFKSENPKLALSLYERYIQETNGGGHLDGGGGGGGGQHTARTTNTNKNNPPPTINAPVKQTAEPTNHYSNSTTNNNNNNHINHSNSNNSLSTSYYNGNNNYTNWNLPNGSVANRNALH